MMRIVSITLFLSVFALPLAAQYQRVVTLGGPVTEIVFALGAGDQVVAVDSSSVFPEKEIDGLPVVGYVAAVGAEGLLGLEPDLIVATSRLGPPAVVEQLKSTGVPLLIVDSPNDIPSLKDAVYQIGKKLGRDTEAKGLWSKIDRDLSAANQFAEEHGSPTVVFLLGSRGAAMAAGTDTQGGGILTLAGGKNLFSDFNGYKPITEEAILAANPDIILVGRHQAMPGEDVGPYMKRIGLERLAESTQAEIFMIGMSEYLTFGPRTGQAALKLAELFADSAK